MEERGDGMSSILIKGMEMPKYCAVCPVCRKEPMDWHCTLLRKIIGVPVERKPECPLEEIPPHGRLIDADKMMMSLADWWYSSFGQEETEEAKAIRAVMDKIEQSIDVMTVIEAEGSEE